MAVSLSPLFNNDQTVTDANGVPRSGAKIFTYRAGTSTKETAYKDSAGSVAHTNPIILDANGLPPAPVWLTQGLTHKFVLAPPADTDPPASAILSIDNITGINDVADVVTTEWTASGMTPTYISASSFSVTGDQTTTLHVGRRLKLTESGSSLYGTIIKSTFTSLTTVTVLLDSGTLSSDFTGNTFWYGIVSAANTSAPFLSRDQQCGRLVGVSAASIRLDPQDGNTIWVYTAAAGWTRRRIGSAGISAANMNTYVDGVSGQSLSTTPTTYYVYLFDNSGTLTIDFSTNGTNVDSTSGLKIKAGDATRLLIGMVRTNASGQFVDAADERCVISWYKRRAITSIGALTTTRTTTSTSVVELNTEIRAEFLTWAEEAVLGLYSGYASNSTAAQTHASAIYIDGTSTAFSKVANAQTVTGTYTDSIGMAAAGVATEGYHFLTVGVNVSANTGSWLSGQLSAVTQG